MKKKCYLCGEIKDTTLFAKDSSKKSGYSSRCLICNRVRNKKYRDEHKDYFKKYIRDYYAKNPEKFATSKGRYNGKYKKDLVKNRARNKLEYAVNHGKILKQPCSVCGNVNSEAHHEDYLQPLKVVWLCKKHHGQLR